MCGRFEFFTEEFPLDLTNLLSSLFDSPSGKTPEGLPWAKDPLSPSPLGSSHETPAVLSSSTEPKKSEVFPGSQTFVWTQAGFQVMIWGWPNPIKKGLLINIRSETLLQKPLFANRLDFGRGIVFAKGYHEWDSRKKRYFFQEQGQNYVAMAALWNRYQEADRFAILTTAALEAAAQIHHRMPLLLSKDQIPLWLADKSSALSCLCLPHPSVDLRVVQEEKIRQLSFFD